MRIRALFVFLLVIFLSGCATTGRNQDIQVKPLQSKVNYLEAELQRKNQEISSLESELDEAKGLGRQKRKDSSSLRLSIQQIQKALRNAGFYRGPIDGKIGPQTKQAIKEFQKANGLKPDGIVGRRTAEKLNSYLQ